MSPSPWQRFLKVVGLNTIDDRIESVRVEAAMEEKDYLNDYYHERDKFALELESLEHSDDIYHLGTYRNAFDEDMQANVLVKDFRVHKYIVGTTGTGKTCFIENLVKQHIFRGDGVGVLDVHGDLYRRLCRWVAVKAKNQTDPGKYLREKVVLIDFTDDTKIPGINPLEPIAGISSDRQANQLILIFRRFYKNVWGVKIEELARFGFMALIESGQTLLELEDLLTNDEFRQKILEQVRTPAVLKYFQNQFKNDVQYVGAMLNKFRPLLLDQKIQSIIGQQKSTINFRDILDQEKIMLVNLNKSYLSANADLMAAMFMGWIQNAALSRRELPEHHRRPFFLFVDEFQNFANQQFEEILTESRKFAIYLTMAHQSTSQLDSSLRHITLGNTDIHCFFRVEAGDSDALGKGTFDARGGIEKQVSSPYEQSTGFLSDREEIQMLKSNMSSLENRCFYYRHKGKSYKARQLRTADLGSAHIDAGMDRAEFSDLVHQYLRISQEEYTQS
ncbi:type IV secretion system DNA-binding domain-containing protein, partial [bacterium]|nr:type IV secretion system DNA-binding domain-containing protein [bacterium]